MDRQTSKPVPAPLADAGEAAPPAHASEHPLLPGHRIGRYTIERLLGRGGMGEVYCAHDQRLERQVALKLLPAAHGIDTRARRRLLREARAASTLSHPGIVTVHEFGEDHGRTFIVMELVEGETLRALLARRGRLAPAEAVEILTQVADAVHAVHEAGLVHRDLKPANAIIDRRGRVKILDFGLSKRLGTCARAGSVTGIVAAMTETHMLVSPMGETARPEELLARHGLHRPGEPPAAPMNVVNSGCSSGTVYAASALDELPAGNDALETAAGVVLGTPGYAAAELMAGGPAGVHSDVFALGVIAYELVTGRRPYAGASLLALRAAVERGEYTPASVASGGAVDASFDAALAPALEPWPSRRPANVAVLIGALHAAVAPPVVTRARRRRVSSSFTAAWLSAGLALFVAPARHAGANASTIVGGVAPGTSRPAAARHVVEPPDEAARAVAELYAAACDHAAYPPTVEACRR